MTTAVKELIARALDDAEMVPSMVPGSPLAVLPEEQAAISAAPRKKIFFISFLLPAECPGGQAPSKKLQLCGSREDLPS